MKIKNYLILCASVSAVWTIALLAIPVFSDFLEYLMLIFLSTNAR